MGSVNSREVNFGMKVKSKLFNSEASSDVCFVVGEQKTKFYAHRAFLKVILADPKNLFETTVILIIRSDCLAFKVHVQRCFRTDVLWSPKGDELRDQGTRLGSSWFREHAKVGVFSIFYWLSFCAIGNSKQSNQREVKLTLSVFLKSKGSFMALI